MTKSVVLPVGGARDQEEGMSIMGAPRNVRLPAEFDLWFPQGLYLVGEITPVMEYQSAEDKARNRPVRPRTDEASGLPLFRGTFADPAAEKDREKSVTVEFACAHQPVPPEQIAGLPFRSVVLEGMTVQPRAETSGQAKWITWIVRATGMKAPGGVASPTSNARTARKNTGTSEAFERSAA